MKGTWVEYTPQQLAWIKRHCRLPRRALQLLFVNKFKRRDVTIQNLKSLCLRKGWKTGRTGCYPKGSVPLNKGKKMPFNANCAATQFKKGQRSHNTRFPGYEYVEKKDGYVLLCVAETNPHTGFEHRFVLKHKYLWQKKNGPVPEGMRLKSLDGNRTNTEPSNWVAIPRAMGPRLSGRWGMNYDKAPAEMKPTLMAIAQLETAARAKRQHPGKEQ